MNNTFPLDYDYQSDGSIVIRAAQGNHYAKTFDPSAAAFIVAGPDMLSALRKAKDWMEDEELGWLDDHDKAIHAETMEAINAAITKTTQP
jgi:hypothetical protein